MRAKWEMLRIRTIGEYSDLYMKIDVLLLAEVFENFRDSCVASCNLDPAHYPTTASLTWDAMLEYTSVELRLLTDIDMVLFLESCIRGRLSKCSNRYAIANNKYMNEGYDENNESTYSMYYDVNNLYGWPMTKGLPYDNFRWIDDSGNFDVQVIDDTTEIGYILEVDLNYSLQIHDQHSYFPFCSEQKVASVGSRKAYGNLDI